MVRRTTPVAWAGLLLAAAAAACGGGSPDAQPAPPPGDAAAGAVVYERNCAVCHRSDLGGGSGPALGPGSPASTRSMDHLRNVILDGGNGMPAWRGILSATEIEQVVAFLAASQRRSPAP